MPDPGTIILAPPRPPGIRRAAPVPRFARRAAAPPRGPTTNWVLAFVLFQFACQVALLVPALSPVRIVLRSASFGASLLLLLILRPSRSKFHPSAGAAAVVLAVVAYSLLHPDRNTALAAAAQALMYAAIVAPLFWVPRLRVDAAGFRRLVLTLWAFHTLSAGVGVAQVYFPGALQPQLSPVVEARGADYVDSLTIRLPDGQSVFRPMGLTDQPGGACMAGLYAVLFGLGLFLCEESWAIRGAALLGMLVGLVCIYLSQVRSVLVMAGVCCCTFCAVLALRRDFARLGGAVLLIGLVVLASLAWAVSLGGDAVSKRLSSLVEEDASEVYYSNRGHFLEQTIDEYLPQYPLGAGPGRWGMMNQYFGENSDERTEAIWVEIQWTGWLLDGGVPLVLAYAVAIFATFIVGLRVALDRRLERAFGFDRFTSRLGVWAALIFAYNMAALAVTFNYPLFMSQGGLEFWLLNACLFGAYARETAILPAAPRGRRPAKRLRVILGYGPRRGGLVRGALPGAAPLLLASTRGGEESQP